MSQVTGPNGKDALDASSKQGNPEQNEAWYWVKAATMDDPWEVAAWTKNGESPGEWHLLGLLDSRASVALVGDRIPAPGEGWQSVPRQPSDAMLTCLGDDADAYHGLLGSWTLLLSHAPKP